MKLTSTSTFTAIAVALVVASLAVGFYLVGPPGEVRAHRLDGERLSHLQSVESAVDSYQTQQGALPATLQAAVEQSNVVTGQTRDPETGAPLEYRRTSSTTYDLCARFAAASSEGVAMRWRHGPGRQCFSFQIKPRQTPPQLGYGFVPQPAPAPAIRSR
ncbi:hypothetical protein [Phenylobacterium montanum]|uniref:Type II secretion system protein n=1 Tax=Phenylobacterium montanum TaxID=2823693 RepID=A0A975ITJ0_9CAUL|nr:hypothetical protein [Caulobacter sp. S6]QUD86838.1 hypothetical protein KCG34_17395 [Caulobacter sp. S6]